MDKKEHKLRKELADINSELSHPDVFGRSDYPALAKRQGELAKIIGLFDEKAKLEKSKQEAEKLARDKDPGIAEMAKDEIEKINSKLEPVASNLSVLFTPSDPNDERDVIIEIRAAAGGDEASLFAGELYRMYVRWAENHGFKTEHISDMPLSFTVKGDQAYKSLKYEGGVHRVQRIPATESQGRVHTSTVTVAVLPEAEETDIEIKPEDIRVDVFRSGGHGGQSVNTTDSAVRVTHLPTGIVITNQDEKSQIKNRKKALSVLRSRLLAKKIADEQKEMSEARRSLIGSGDRSEKIRTYNFPQDRITDHRINFSRSNIDGALNGNIDDLITNLQKAESELAKT